MTKIPRPLPPPELAAAVGTVVMAAASVEDQAGELIGLLDGVFQDDNPDFTPTMNDWAQSGERLVAAMRERELPWADQLGALLQKRNEVVHGIVLLPDRPVFATMKRVIAKRSDVDKSPKFKTVEWSIPDLLELAASFERIEADICKEVSKLTGVAPRIAVSGEL